MQRRVTAVELRPINLLTASQVAAATDDNEELDPGPDTVVGLNAPNQYKRVVGGYFYSNRITGTKNSRAEIYFASDPGLEDGKTVRVSGIHKIIHGTNIVDLDVSGDFKIVAVDTPPYEGRATYGGKRQTPGENVDSTVLFNPESGTQYSEEKELIVKFRISTIEATTTTAKIVFTSPNYFKTGDVVFVDMPTDTPFFGLDGLYKVKTAGSDFIEVSFESALDEPINSSSVTEERYVHATAQALIRDGATWISPDNVVYVWNDIRWVLFKSDVAKDSKAPGPVTDLDATDEVDTISGSTTPTSRVTLTWTAPTKNADNSTLDDLVGYTIWHREDKSPRPEWEKSDITGSETTTAISGLLQGKTYAFRVFARDSGGNLSTGVTKLHFVGVSLPTVQKPAAPTVTTYLGTIKISYDDLTASGLVQPATAKEIEVYFSDLPAFVAGEDNFYGKFPANAGSYIIIPGTELVDNTDYYIRLIVRDVFGNITEASDPPVTIRARLSNIVTFDMIDVGTLTGQVIIGADIRTASEPFNDGGLILNQDGLVAYDDDGQQTFRIDATTGQVSIGDYLSASEAAGLYITDFDAEQSYATIATADGIRVIAGTAEQLAAAANSKADAADLKVSAVTEITPGTINVVRMRRNEVVGAINRDITSSTKINGGVITTGTIKADQIGTGKFPVDVIYGGNIEGNQLTVNGTITGNTVRTNPDDAQRVTMSAATNSFRVFNSGGTEVGSVSGGSLSGVGLRVQNSSDEYLSLYPGVIDLQGTNVGIQIRSSATRSASTITIDSGRVSVPKFGTDISVANGTGIVTAFNGTGLNDGSLRAEYLGGTDNGVVQVASDGNPFRRDMRGTGQRNVVASAGGFLSAPSSDERLKKDIQPLDVGLAFIDKLSPKKYVFKAEPDMVEYGLIAQEVRHVIADLGIKDNTNLVFEDSSDYKLAELSEGESGPVLGIEYMKLIPILINSVKELKSRVEFLENQIDGDR